MSEEYTITEDNIKKIIELLEKYRPKKVELFELHTLGEKKYKALNREMKVFKKIDKEKIEKLYNLIKSININVEVIKI